nr:electron transfer flavoprotein subunit beta/FixA family protein [uncultured Sphaerochaeta sp.]
MNIICLVKFVPDITGFGYDYEASSMIRNHTRMVLNPDDVSALSFAFKLKEKHPESHLQVVSMAPTSVIPHMHDLLRLPVDQGILISDPLFAGSDTYATSEVLGSYLKSQSFDVLLSGSRSLDGATSQVPAQIAEMLDLDHVLDVNEIDIEITTSSLAVFSVEGEREDSTWSMQLPGVLSLSRNNTCKLPYPSYADLQRDVSEKLTILTNKEMALNPSHVGLEGSLTKVVNTYEAKSRKRTRTVVEADDEGIEFVLSYLKERGFM